MNCEFTYCGCLELGSCVAVVSCIGMGCVSSYLNQEVRDSCNGSSARSVFAVSNDLAKESPRNESWMKDASEDALVLREDLAKQFFGEEFRKTLGGKSAEDSLKLEGALAP